MGFDFRPARRDTTSTLIALSGPSGSGKTYTAINYSLGLAYPGMTGQQINAAVKAEGRSRICVIDSEGGRALHYAPKPGCDPDFKSSFPFEYAELRPPFTPQSYQDVVVAADEAGFNVVVIDSFSHEYESEGGILEWADRLAEGVPKPGIQNPELWKRDHWIEQPVKSPGNWKEPKRAHKKAVNRFLQCRCHLIFCLRAEEKMQLVQEKTDVNGRERVTVKVVPASERPVNERWEPICEKRFMYEMTASFVLLPGDPGVGVPLKLQEQHRHIFPEGERIGSKSGALMAEWASGTGQASPPANTSTPGKRSPEQLVELYEERAAACASIDDLRAFQSQTGTQQFIDQIRGTPDLFNRVTAVNKAAYERLAGPSGDGEYGAP